MTSQRWAGAVLFALGAMFMTMIMLAASIAPGYPYSTAAISDLGVTPATATLFNASLVVAGILNICGGYLFFDRHRRRAVLALYIVAGIGAIGAGIFPLDTGTPHSVSALLAFVFFNLEAIASGLIVRGPARWISVAAGLIGLGFVGLMIAGDSGTLAAFGAIGHGGTERMIVYPPMIWLMMFGGYLLGERSLRTC